MRYLSIRVKLLMLTLIILIPLITLQSIDIYDHFQNKIKQKLQANVELADTVSKSFVNYLNELWIQESFISDHILDHINSPKEIQAYLENIVNSNKHVIERLSWVSPEGKIIANSRKYLIGKSLAKRDYYQRIIAGKDEVISDLIMSYVDGKLVIPVAKAIKRKGKLMGILIYSMDASKLISHIPTLKINDGEVLCLIDRNGNMAYNSSNNSLAFEKRKILPDAPGWKALKGEIVKTPNGRSDFDSHYYLSVDYPIKEIGWVCSISSKKSIVLKDIYRQVVESSIVLAFVSIMSLITSFILSKKITDPLVVLKNKADQLKLGDYSVRTNINGFDEIASTAQAFDLMADSIEQYDKLKGQYFSNLSHEFKTPINVIYASIQLIESLQNNLDYKEFKHKTLRNTNVIRQNCYRLIKLVDNIIDVTRYDTGHFKMNPYETDIVSVIENICLSVAKYSEQKGVTIVFDTEVEEMVICCDPYMIERILLNLISNSLKFTDTSGFIYVNIHDREDEDEVIFTVRDTGIGIPEDKLSIIFDRFRQVDTSLSRNQEGSGLGLSIVSALVEAHKGSITVNSKLGVGTEFVIKLPKNGLCKDKNENNKFLFKDENFTIKKIEIEFSDIYSIDKSYVD